VVELTRVADAYFGGDHAIAGVLHLVDARHPRLDADLDAAKWLQSLAVERAVLATKIDKLSRNARGKNLKELERQLGMAALPISATSGEGLDDLWTLIARLSRR
jgi:GTP-binding protein